MHERTQEHENLRTSLLCGKFEYRDRRKSNLDRAADCNNVENESLTNL